MTAGAVPETVVTLWLVTVALAVVVLVPLAVYWLARLVRAAWSIRAYARECVGPARAIAAATAALPALDDTIGVATEILSAAEAVAGKLDATAGVFEARAARLG